MPGGELTPGTAAGSPGACEAASPAVLAVLRDGIAVRGATLSNVFAVRAGAAEGVAGWWVAGKLSGAGVAPEVVVWVVTGIDNLKADGVVAANAAAARSSRWTLPDGEDLTGAGRDAAVACVGPMPPA